jgi:hypothetical protein
MSTPTGQISVNNVENTLNEGLSTNYPGGTSRLTFNDSLVRTLASRPSGSISMNDMRGKAGPTPYGTVISSGCSGSTLTSVIADGRYGTTTTTTLNSPLCRVSLTVIVSTNQTNVILTVSSVTGYVKGNTDLSVIVNGGVIISSSSTSQPAFIIGGISSGDIVRLYNNGYIVGRGGDGGTGGGGNLQNGSAGGNGGPALRLDCSIWIGNIGTIGGGGGGGGGGSIMSGAQSVGTRGGGGGGGAGYGAGGTYNGSSGTATAGGAGGSNGSSGGTGGGLGASGGTGSGASFNTMFSQVSISSGYAGGSPGAAINRNGNTLYDLLGNPITSAAQLPGNVYGSLI